MADISLRTYIELVGTEAYIADVRRTIQAQREFYATLRRGGLDIRTSAELVADPRFRETREDILRWNREYERQTREAQIATRRFGFAVRTLAGQGLWASLSIMFNVMALGRYMRSMGSSERITREMTRIQRELTEVNRELATATLEYGASSDVVARLQERRTRLTERLIELEYRLADTQIATMSSSFMLAYSLLTLGWNAVTVAGSLHAMGLSLKAIIPIIGFLAVVGVATFNYMLSEQSRLLKEAEERTKRYRAELGRLDGTMRGMQGGGGFSIGGHNPAIIRQEISIHVRAETPRVGRQIAEEIGRYLRETRPTIG